MATVLDPVKAPAGRHERYVQKQLTDATRRVQMLDVATAGLGLLIGTLVYGLAMIFLDRWLHLSRPAREVGLFGFLGVAAVYTWFVLLRPFRLRVNPYYAARQVEDTLPDAKNSIVNWLDLHDGELSPVVKDAIGRQAATDLEAADMQQAIRGNHLTWLGTVAVGLIVGMLLALAVMRPDQFFSLLNRTFNPFDNLAVARQTTITIVSPAGGNVVVPVNQSLLIKVNVAGKIPDSNKPDSLKLLMRRTQDEAIWDERPLGMGSENREWFVHLKLHDVQNGFFYKITGGDDATEEYRVTVRSTPLLSRFNVTYRFRPYLRWSDREAVDPNLEALRGTEVTLVAHANRPVREGRLVLTDEPNGRPIIATLMPDEPNAMKFKLRIDRDSKYQILFTTADGEANTNPLPYSIKAIADNAPELRFTKPEQLNAKEPESDLRIPANGLLKLEGEVTDDFGVTSVTLRIKHDGSVLAPKPYRDAAAYRLAENRGFMRSVEYKDFVDLEKLQTAAGTPAHLKAGDTLEFWLEATDNCDYPEPGPNVGRTKKTYKVIVLPPVNNEDEKKNQREAAKQDQKKQDEKHAKDQAEQSAEQKKQDDAKAQDKPKEGENKPDTEKRIEEAKKQLAKEQAEPDKPKEGEKKPDDNAKGEPKPDPDAPNKPEKPDGAKPNPKDGKPDEKKGDNKDMGQSDPKTPPAEPKDDKQNAGQGAGDKKGQPQSQPDDKGGMKPAGESTPDQGAKGDPNKKPMDGSEGKAGEGKDKGKPDSKPGDKNEGPDKDPMGKNEPGQAKGNDGKQPDKPAGSNEKDPKAAQNNKPGDEGPGEPKGDNKGKEGDAKKNPPKQDGDGKGDRDAKAEGGNAKAEKNQVAKGETKPGNNDPKGNAPPNGEPRPDKGGAQDQQAKADSKPAPKDPNGKGDTAAGNPKADQSDGGQDDVNKLAEQMQKGDPKAQQQAKQDLEKMAKDGADPQKQQAAKDALAKGDPSKGRDMGESKSPPEQPKPGDPKGPDKVADNKPMPKDAKPGDGKPGDGKPEGQSDPKAEKAQAKGNDAPKPGQPKPGDAQAKAGEGKKEGDKSDGKPGDGKPQSKPGDAKDAAQAKNGPNGEKPGEGQKPGDGQKPGEGAKPSPDATAQKGAPPPDAQLGKPMEGAGGMGEQPGVAKAGPDEKGEGKGQGPGKDPKPSPTAGNDPGDGSTLPERSPASGDSSPEQRGKIAAANEDFKKRGGGLQLDKIDPKKLKEVLEKNNISEEEWQRHLAAEARRMREQQAAKADPTKANLLPGDRSGASRVNAGPQAVKTDPNAKVGDAHNDGAGIAPPEYKDAGEKFSTMIQQPRTKKKP